MLRVFASGRFFGDTFGDGPPVVLALHGWRRTHRDFAGVLEGLDALALDLPGFGSTPEPPEPWGSAEYAAALDPVLDELSLPAVVLGHSFGGRVAVHLAARRPEAVKALVLTGVPLRRVGGATKPALAYRVARALHRRKLVSEARMDARRERYGSEDYRAAKGVMRDVFVRIVNETYEDELRRITCPVELVWGDDDTAAPVAAAKWAADILCDAKLTVRQGAGHLTPLTIPDELRAAVERQR